MIKALKSFIAIAGRIGLTKRVFACLLAFNLASIMFEGLGIIMLLPIFDLLRSGNPEDTGEIKGRFWDILREIFGAVGVPLSLGLLLIISFTFLVSRQTFSYMNRRAQRHASRRLADSVRQRAFTGFLQTQTRMQDQLRIGEVVADLTVDLQRALTVLFSIPRILGTLAQVGIYVGGLLLLSPAMTALSVCVIAIAGFFSRSLLTIIKEAGAAISETNSELSAFMIERLQHARLIRLSGMEKAELAAFAKLSRRYSSEQLRQKAMTTRLALFPEPIAVGFGYIVLYVGGRIFGLSLAVLAVFVLVLVRLMPIVRNFMADYTTILGQWPSVERVDRRLTSLSAGREPRGGNRIFDQLDQEIVYENVSFNYHTERAPALSNVTVTLPAHRMSALIGPSGAGKSTFVDLLPRLREPTEGQIRIDGVPISEFTNDSLRAGISYVPQQPQIFNITAAEHIRYGKEDATDAEVREAARLAGALNFIEALPEGFNTLLGDGGKQLSGGQRQRMDIARALVRRAPVMVLDEPTSALDAEAEAAFRDALRTLRSTTYLTIIVIAHRLSTIADADQIVVLNDGRVEAVGTHQDLVVMGGWYAKAYYQQAGAFEFGKASAAE